MNKIAHNRQLLAHASSLLYAISALVDNLEEPEILEELLKKLGANHYRHGVTVGMFDNLRTCLVGYLKDLLPNKMDEFYVESWDKACKYMVAVIQEGLDAAAAAVIPRING